MVESIILGKKILRVEINNSIGDLININKKLTDSDSLAICNALRRTILIPYDLIIRAIKYIGMLALIVVTSGVSKI